MYSLLKNLSTLQNSKIKIYVINNNKDYNRKSGQ